VRKVPSWLSKVFLGFHFHLNCKCIVFAAASVSIVSLTVRRRPPRCLSPLPLLLSLGEGPWLRLVTNCDTNFSTGRESMNRWCPSQQKEKKGNCWSCYIKPLACKHTFEIHKYYSKLYTGEANYIYIVYKSSVFTCTVS